jgi:hypothetical protein
MKLSLVLAFLFTVNLLHGQNFSLKATLDTNRIVIGDQVNLTLKVTQSGNYKFAFPVLLDTIVKSVEIVGRTQVDTIKTSTNESSLEQVLTLSSFEAGMYHLPPFRFAVELNGQKDTLQSNSLMLEVVALEVDTSKGIFDIKTPVDAPFTWKEFIHEYLPYIVGGLVAIVAIIFTLYYLRKRKKGEPVIKKYVPKDPPHIIALRDLELLKEKKLWQQDKFKAYHSELAEIVRRYIESRFQIQAMERTTDEILHSFANSRIIENETFEKLNFMLTLADMVKFAKLIPMPDENENCLKAAYLFVENTIFRSHEIKPEELTKTK